MYQLFCSAQEEKLSDACKNKIGKSVAKIFFMIALFPSNIQTDRITDPTMENINVLLQKKQPFLPGRPTQQQINNGGIINPTAHGKVFFEKKSLAAVDSISTV